MTWRAFAIIRWYPSPFQSMGSFTTCDRASCSRLRAPLLLGKQRSEPEAWSLSRESTATAIPFFDAGSRFLLWPDSRTSSFRTTGDDDFLWYREIAKHSLPQHTVAHRSVLPR